MNVDKPLLMDWMNRRIVRHGAGWGDARETACLMTALSGGQNSIEGCVAQGWPEWLAELGTVIFDNAPEDCWRERSIAFADAATAFVERGGDPDRAFRDIRLRAILPIAAESIGDGDEPWRIACREAVQGAIENDGEAAWAAWAAKAAGAEEAAGAAGAAWAARAAWAAGAAEAAGAAWAAGAAEAAGAAWAARAARAAWGAEAARAAWAARAEAHTRIFEETVRVLRAA